MPSAGQKRLSRWAPRHARSLKNCVCALQESPPRPLRLVSSTPARTLTSHIAVRLGPRRPIYVPGLARAGRGHRSKRCATWACRWGLDQGMRPGAARPYPHASSLVQTFGSRDIKSPVACGVPPLRVPVLISLLPNVPGVPIFAPRGGRNRHFHRSVRSIPGPGGRPARLESHYYLRCAPLPAYDKIARSCLGDAMLRGADGDGS